MGKLALYMGANACCRMNTTMWFQPGWYRNDTVAILESPGKEEMLANRPAVGETGENLCHLLCDLRESNIELCKRTIEIINASRIPHYNGALDGNNANEKEIDANIEFAESRLIRDEITHILCFGKYARLLLYKLGKGTVRGKVVICCPHIGKQGLADGKKCYNWTNKYKRLGICQGRLKEISVFIKKKWNIHGVHEFSKRKKIVNVVPSIQKVGLL